MTTEFSSLNLRPELVQAITELGYITPTAIQAGMIPLMLTGVDVIGQAQTGTGKTAAFALPILHNFIPQQLRRLLCLRLRVNLLLQVAAAMERIWQTSQGACAGCLWRTTLQPAGQPASNAAWILSLARPGRFIDLMERKVLDLSMIKTVVLDEADEMLNMGFIEQVEKILSATPGIRQTALFSATMPVRIRTLAERFMRDPQSVIIKQATLTLSGTEQRYYLVHEDDKLTALTNLFEIEPITSALIFARTRIETGQLANELSCAWIPRRSH